jgi:DNA primase
MIFCPFHNNYRSPAGEVSKETGIFWCFSCQESKDLPEVIMQATKRSYFEAIRLIDSKKDNKNLSQRVENALNKKVEFKEFDTDLIIKLNESALNSSRAAQYYKSRSITKDSVIKYKLGYSEKQDMVTIPVYSPEGICLGFVGRSIEGKVFKNTPGLPKSKTLFNLQNAKRHDKVFIVESSFDAIRLEQVGVHAVATLGATISHDQRRLIKQYFNQIFLLADNDEAGKIMANKLKTHFGDGCIVSELPSNVKDVSDMNDEDLGYFVSKVDNLASLMVKLSNAHIQSNH